MTQKSLLFITLLFRSFSAQSADLCSNPVRAICGAPSPVPVATVEQIRAEVSAGLGAQGLTSLTGDSVADVHLLPGFKKYMSAVSKLVLAKFSKSGVPETELSGRIAQITASVAGNLESGRIGKSVVSGPVSDDELAARVRSVKIAQIPESDLDAEAFYENCGADGLIDQAYYDPDMNTFFLCPGFLLTVLNSGTLAALDQTIAHELSHSVDGSAVSERYGRYASYLSCVQNNYGEAFESADRVIDQLGAPAQKRLSVYLENLKMLPGEHGAEIIAVQDQMRIARQDVAYIRSASARISKKLGHSPSSMDLHADELTADLAAGEAVLKLIGKMPQPKRAEALIETYRTYCDEGVSSARAVRMGTLKDDGLHPPNSFRLSILFNNPQLRLLVGCKNLSGTAPFCSSGELSPLAARCTRGMGITSTSQCEAAIGNDLKVAGCKVSGLECEAFDGKQCGCLFESSNCKLASRKYRTGGLACIDQGVKEELRHLDALIPGVCIFKRVSGAEVKSEPSGASGAR